MKHCAAAAAADSCMTPSRPCRPHRPQADGSRCESVQDCLAAYRDWGATERDCGRCLQRLPARRRSLITSLPQVLVLALKRAKRDPRGAGRCVRSAHKVAVRVMPAPRACHGPVPAARPWHICTIAQCALHASHAQRTCAVCLLQIESEFIIRRDMVRRQHGEQDSQQPAAVADGDPVAYKLRAVVRHTGSGLNSGHYIADVLVGDSWFRFNDDKAVEPLQRESRSSRRTDVVPEGPCAYVLFYERRA